MAPSRRQVLEAGLLGAASLGFGRCAAQAGPRKHALPDAPRRSEASTVAVVRAADYPGVAAAVRAAVESAGGLGFIRPGDSVLLKPAVNSGNRYPATADPETVLAVARLVQEAGGEPFIGDRTMFLHSTADAFRETGILDAAAQAKIPCLALEDTEVVALSHPLAANWPGSTLHVYKPAAEADHVINLCTPRTHKLGGLTMAIKNNVGVIAGNKRTRMHLGSGFRQRLAEISLVMRPSLIVLDGRMGFADGGPDEGALVRPGLIAAGTDPLAIDAVGVAMLRMAGTNATLSSGSIWKIPMLERAAAIGLGAAGPEAIRLVALDPEGAAALRAKLS